MSLPEPEHETKAEIAAILDRLEKGDAGDDVYARARESLESTIAGLKLTAEEEPFVAEELQKLRELTEKLDDNRVEIAAFGMVSRGKSSLMNALLGREVFKTGSTHGTTVLREAQRWEVSAPRPDGFEEAKLVLVDTPGIDEVGGEVREALANEVARHADLILFVVSGDITRREFDALAALREARKPIIVVFNQVDRYPDADRELIYAKITNERVRDMIRPEDVVMTAARPDPYRVKIKEPDGKTSVVWEHPAPMVEPLKRRILEVLEQEGKALIALNTLLFAGDVHEEIVARKVAIRDDAANRLIWNYSLTKGVAVAVNPIPVADLLGGLAVDVAMVMALSKVYGLAITRKTARGLVLDSLKSLGALGAVDVVAKFGFIGVKALLAGSTALSGGLAAPLTALGYASFGTALGGTAAYTSYILGQAAKVYLRKGKDWGPAGINTVIQEILEAARHDSVIELLSAELKKRLGA